MSEPLRYELLGPLRVLHGSKELPVGGPQQRQLLALLVNAIGCSVATTKLIDEIWGEDPPDKARNSIQQYVHHLRGQVGDALETVPGGYALDTSGAVGTAEFEALLKASENMRPMQRASKLGDALNLWRGEAFVDFADCEWAKPLILRLTELRDGALEDQAEALILSGEPLAAMAVVVPQIEEHPLRDRPRALLMRSLAAQGRHTEALRAYQEYRNYLGETTGTEPSQELRELEGRIAAGWSDQIDNAPSHALAGSRGANHNLRTELNTFVHRPEVAQLAEMLESRRLVTIVGPGGIGKSRCSVAVGRHIAEMGVASDEGRWSDGVWFVDLSTVADADREPWKVMVDALGLRKAELTMSETVFEYLRERDLLIILDNCEHVLSWVRDFTSELLETSAKTAVVATSRVRLDTVGEQTFVLDPMSEFEALQLFETRAAEAGAGPFPVDDSIALCTLLDNYPLAIELAAGRSRTLSAREIADRLTSHPDLLRKARTDGPQRHVSFSAALDWSLSQLSPESLKVLRHAAIFRSNFDMRAAEAVIGQPGSPRGEVLDHLDSLVEQNLINRDHLRARFRILEPIRQSVTTLAHTPELERIHGEYYLALMRDIAAGLLTPDEPIWWDSFQNDLPNIRDAMNWAIANSESALIESVMTRLPPAVQNLLLTEAAEWAADALQACDLKPVDVPATAMTAAMGWHRRGSLAQSEKILADLEQENIHSSLRAMLCYVRSTQQFMAGKPGEALEWGRKCVDFAKADGDQALVVLGLIVQIHPDAVAEADELGTPMLQAYSRFFAFGMMDEPNKLDALRFVTDAYNAALRSHNPLSIASGETVLAAVLFRRVETAKGAGLMLKGVEAMLRYRSHFLVRHVIETVANGLAGEGYPHRPQSCGLRWTLRERAASPAT